MVICTYVWLFDCSILFISLKNWNRHLLKYLLDDYSNMSKTFDDMCEAFEKIDAEAYAEALKTVSGKVIGDLNALTNPDIAKTLYSNFVLCTIVCGGKIDEKEFGKIKPTLDAAIGIDIKYSDVEKAFENVDKGEYKDKVDELIDLVGDSAPSVRDNIITLCLLVCAADGKITDKEKCWIRQLLD